MLGATVDEVETGFETNLMRLFPQCAAVIANEKYVHITNIMFVCTERRTECTTKLQCSSSTVGLILYCWSHTPNRTERNTWLETLDILLTVPDSRPAVADHLKHQFFQEALRDSNDARDILACCYRMYREGNGDSTLKHLLRVTAVAISQCPACTRERLDHDWLKLSRGVVGFCERRLCDGAGTLNDWICVDVLHILRYLFLIHNVSTELEFFFH